MKLNILNSRELKNIRKLLEQQFKVKEKLPYVFLLSEKNDLYIIKDSVKKIDFEKLKINTMGIYFGELKDVIRLSIEGSQIIGKLASKNVYEVDDKVAKMWMYGLDIPCKEEFEDYVIIKNKNDFLGCGKYKEEKILNYVPKGRRIH